MEITALFFRIENCYFVLNHYRKLAPDLNHHFLLFRFSTIFQDKINDFYLIYDTLFVIPSKSCADTRKHLIIEVYRYCN